MKDDLMEVLSNNYMLAGLVLRTWGATKTDRAVTAEFTESKGATRRAASVIKHLLADNDDALRAVTSAFQAMRGMFYARTLPWSTAQEGKQRGDRIVACTDVMDFIRDFDAAKRSARALLDQFVAAYPGLVANAARSQGELYNPADYPSPEAIRSAFGAELSINTLPAATNYDRLAIPGKLASGLRSMYARRAELELESAMTDLRERMVEELQRIHTQLSKVATGEPTKLHKTLVDNLRGVVKLARSMGPLDMRMASIADAVEGSLLLHNSVEVFKGNASLSREFANRAKHFERVIVEGLEVAPPPSVLAELVSDADEEPDDNFLPGPELSASMLQLSAMLVQAEATLEPSATSADPAGIVLPDDAFDLDLL